MPQELRAMRRLRPHPALQVLSQRLPYSLPRHVQRLWQHPGFADDADEISVRCPAWKNVHVDVSNHTGPRGSSDIHAEIDAIGSIERAQNGLHPLSQNHHLVGGIGGEILPLRHMRVRHDHDMSIRVRIGIENDVAMRPAVDDAGLLVAFFGSIAEDAARLLGSTGNVCVAPRSPEMVHGARVAETSFELRATSLQRSGAGSLEARGCKLEASAV